VPFRYAFPLDRLESRFKFRGDLAVGALLSALWLRAVTRDPLPEAIVPVPLSRERLRERGFNQALELARPIARALKRPLLPRLLIRTRHTLAQSSLRRKERLRNVQGAFALAPGRKPPPHLALFDDVLTTGATLRECAKVLRRAGATTIEVWAIARAGSEPS
jgi:ComF family protein